MEAARTEIVASCGGKCVSERQEVKSGNTPFSFTQSGGCSGRPEREVHGGSSGSPYLPGTFRLLQARGGRDWQRLAECL